MATTCATTNFFWELKIIFKQNFLLYEDEFSNILILLYDKSLYYTKYALLIITLYLSTTLYIFVANVLIRIARCTSCIQFIIYSHCIAFIIQIQYTCPKISERGCTHAGRRARWSCASCASCACTGSATSHGSCQLRWSLKTAEETERGWNFTPRTIFSVSSFFSLGFYLVGKVVTDGTRVMRLTRRRWRVSDASIIEIATLFASDIDAFVLTIDIQDFMVMVCVSKKRAGLYAVEPEITYTRSSFSFSVFRRVVWIFKIEDCSFVFFFLSFFFRIFISQRIFRTLDLYDR